MKSRRMVKNVVLVFITVMLVLGLAMIVSQTAQGQSRDNNVVDEAGLRRLEQEYIGKIRGYLEQQGFKHSGVNLTWTMEEDGSRSYQVAIYHKGIIGLSVEKQEELLAAVCELAFQWTGCNFRVNLLV